MKTIRIAVLGLVVAGCFEARPQLAPKEAEPPPLAATSKLKLEPEGATNPSNVISVVVSLELVGAPRDSILAAEFVTPHGMPFDRRSIRLQGSPFDTQSHQFSLPVAGTIIDTSGVDTLGTWRVRFDVGGQKVAEETFALQR